MATIVKVLSNCLLFLSADKLRVALSLTGVAFFNTDVVLIFSASKDYQKRFKRLPESALYSFNLLQFVKMII